MVVSWPSGGRNLIHLSSIPAVRLAMGWPIDVQEDVWYFVRRVGYRGQCVVEIAVSWNVRWD